MWYALKTIVAAVVIVAASEIANRSSLFGALVRMRREKVETDAISDLSASVFWLSCCVSAAATFLVYLILARVLAAFGVQP